MMKKLLIGMTCVALCLGTVGCIKSNAKEKRSHDVEKYIDLKIVASDVTDVGSEYIYYDKNTKAMYVSFGGASHSGISAIYNTDGSLKLYEENE